MQPPNSSLSHQKDRGPAASRFQAHTRSLRHILLLTHASIIFGHCGNAPVPSTCSPTYAQSQSALCVPPTRGPHTHRGTHPNLGSSGVTAQIPPRFITLPSKMPQGQSVVPRHTCHVHSRPSREIAVHPGAPSSVKLMHLQLGIPFAHPESSCTFSVG